MQEVRCSKNLVNILHLSSAASRIVYVFSEWMKRAEKEEWYNAQKWSNARKPERERHCCIL